jgi:hypothetical protein
MVDRLPTAINDDTELQINLRQHPTSKSQALGIGQVWVVVWTRRGICRKKKQKAKQNVDCKLEHHGHVLAQQLMIG